MQFASALRGPVRALAVIGVGALLVPSTAQAHHSPVHSAEQVTVEAAANSRSTLPLMIGGGVLLVSMVGVGAYRTRKHPSA